LPNWTVPSEQIIYERLQQIKIARWGEEQFRGILALKADEGGMHYALLDGTGVKLLQGWADAGGDHDTVEPTGPLVSRGLAPFVSEAVARMFLLDPGEYPCNRNGLVSLCLEHQERGSIVKGGYFAGIKIWQVELQSDSTFQNSTATDSYIEYNQPWLGVTITLKKMAKKD
jgi:3',5'-cyclic AMP phosphodiesterase CpdA